MITSFEVGAIFDIEDRASGTIAALAERVRGLTADIAAAKEGLATLGAGDILSGATKGFTNLRDSIFSTKTATDGLGAAMGEMAGAATAAGSEAVGAVDGIGSALVRATEHARALRAEMSRPYEIPAVGGGGGGLMGGGGGGYSDQGRIGRDDIYGEFVTVERQRLLGYAGGGLGGGGGPYGGGPGLSGAYGGSGLAVPGGGGVPPGGIPLNYTSPGAPGRAPQFGLGEMIELGAVYKALHSSMDEGLSIRGAEMGLGLPIEAGPERDASEQKLREIAQRSTVGTIYTEQQTAAAMAALSTPFGFKGPEGRDAFGDIFPIALRSAEVAKQRHLGGLEDTLQADMAYSHMTGRYKGQAAVDGLNRIQAITASVGDQTVHSEEGILKYSVPIGRALGANVDDVADLTGFIQRQGMNSSTAGTGLAALMLQLTHAETIGPNDTHARARRQSAEHEFASALHLTPEAVHNLRSTNRESKKVEALEDIGLLDIHGHIADRNAQGGIDPIAMEHRIHTFANAQPARWARDSQSLDTRALRAAAMFVEQAPGATFDDYRAGLSSTPTAGVQQAAFADTPMQHFEQATARVSDIMNTLGTATLPALDSAFVHATSILSGTNTYLEGHPGAVAGGALTIGSMIGNQLAGWSEWFGKKMGARGMPGSGGMLTAGRMLSFASDYALIGGLSTAISSGADSLFSAGEDLIFGQGHHAAYLAQKRKLDEDGHGLSFGGIWNSIFGGAAHGAEAPGGTTQHTSAIDLINRARPGTVPTSLAAAGAAAPVNSNNTQTVNVGGISVTVNAAPGTEGQAAGQSVVTALMTHLRSFLTHSSGPGEGITSAPGAAGATP